MANSDFSRRKQELREKLDASGRSRRSGRRDAGAVWAVGVIVLVGVGLWLRLSDAPMLSDSVISRPVGLVVLIAALLSSIAGAVVSSRSRPDRPWWPLAVTIWILALAVIVLGLSTITDSAASGPTGFLLLAGATAMVGVGVEVFQRHRPPSE